MDLTLVIPAYNEEAALETFLPEVISFCRKNGFCAIFVDDRSTDGTLALLRKAEKTNDFLKVIHHKVNHGYGGALITGLSAVETEFAVTLDADGQHRLEDILTLVKKQEETDSDMVIGCRGNDSGGGSGWYRALGKKVIRFIANMMVPLNVTDINSGMKLYNTALVQKYLPLCPDGMAFSEVIVMIFLKQKHLVTEAPILVAARKGGSSTISTRTAFNTVAQIMVIVMVLAPMRIFAPIGIISFLAGFLWAIPFLIKGNGLSNASLFAMVLGILTILLGLIADQLAQLWKKGL